MAVSAFNKRSLDGTSVSIGHAEPFLDHIEALRIGVNGAGTYEHFVVEAGDFSAGAGAKTIEVTVADTASNYVVDAWGELVFPFGGGTLSGVTAQVGKDDGPDTDAYVLSHSIFTGQAAASKGFITSERGVDKVPATLKPILVAGKKITVTFTPTGDTMAAATTGKYIVHTIRRQLA